MQSQALSSLAWEISAKDLQHLWRVQIAQLARKHKQVIWCSKSYKGGRVNDIFSQGSQWGIDRAASRAPPAPSSRQRMSQWNRNNKKPSDTFKHIRDKTFVFWVPTDFVCLSIINPTHKCTWWLENHLFVFQSVPLIAWKTKMFSSCIVIQRLEEDLKLKGWVYICLEKQYWLGSCEESKSPSHFQENLD